MLLSPLAQMASGSHWARSLLIPVLGKIAAMLDKRISDENPKSKNHWGYTSAAFSPDSTKWPLRSGRFLARFGGPFDGAENSKFSRTVLDYPGSAFANDNETLVTTSVDDYIRMWNIRTGKEINRDVGQDSANNGEIDCGLCWRLWMYLPLAPIARCCGR